MREKFVRGGSEKDQSLLDKEVHDEEKYER